MRAAPIALATLLLFGAAAARADEKSDAQVLMTQGNEALGEGDYIGALDRFQSAYAKFPSPKILLNIGTTLRQLGRNVEAAKIYEKYISDPNADQARLPDLKRILGEIDAVIGRIHLQVSERGSRVLLDGKELPAFEGETLLRVEPGDHTLVAEHVGFAAAVQTLKITGKQEVAVVLKLLPPDTKTTTKVVVVTKPVSNTQRIVGITVAGVGLVGIGVGSAFGLTAQSTNDLASHHCQTTTACDAKGVSLGNDAKTQALVSTISFVAGGALVAGGTILFLTAPKTKATETRTGFGLGLRAGAEGGTLSAVGTW